MHRCEDRNATPGRSEILESRTKKARNEEQEKCMIYDCAVMRAMGSRLYLKRFEGHEPGNKKRRREI